MAARSNVNLDKCALLGTYPSVCVGCGSYQSTYCMTWRLQQLAFSPDNSENILKNHCHFAHTEKSNTSFDTVKAFVK